MKQADSVAAADVDNDTPCPYYATERNLSLACLELRLPDGKCIAVPYAHFREISFDVDKGIEILCTERRISITGRRLEKLFHHLAAYRVRFVQADVGMHIDDDSVFVEAIYYS